jgi:hypothetical protein
MKKKPGLHLKVLQITTRGDGSVVLWCETPAGVSCVRINRTDWYSHATRCAVDEYEGDHTVTALELADLTSIAF